MNIHSFKISKLVLVVTACMGFLAIACNKNNNNSALPVINKVRLLDPNQKDSLLTKAYPGTYVVIMGSNLEGATNIFINETEIPFNSALMSGSSIVVAIPSTDPTEATKPGVSNTIKLVTTHGETTFKFQLIPLPPSITSISNEMALPGKNITITGAYFYSVKQIVFPGNLAVSNMTFNADSTQISVTVPSNLTAEGPLQVVGKFGTGGNNFIIFNGQHQAGMLADFEDNSPKFGWAWWGGIKTNDATNFPGNRGNYIEIHPSGAVNAGDGAWYGDNRVVNVSMNPLIPAANINDPIGNYALKFEMYQKTPWQNGVLLIRFGNPWKYTYRFTPYVNAPSGQYVTNGWVTVTIPLSEFKDKPSGGNDGTGSPAPNLSALIDKTNGDLGIMLNNDSNSPIPQYDAAFDNIRIVRIK